MKKNYITVTCVDCGCEFTWTKHRKKCDKCNEYAKSIQNKNYISLMEWKVSECEYCKSKYKPKSCKQKFCSSVCRDLSIKEKQEKQEYTGWYKLRFEIFKRDNFTCQYCWRNVKEDWIKLNCDHVFPRNLWWDNSPNNLTTSCFECNIWKSDVMLENILLKNNTIITKVV